MKYSSPLITIVWLASILTPTALPAQQSAAMPASAPNAPAQVKHPTAKAEEAVKNKKAVYDLCLPDFNACLAACRGEKHEACPVALTLADGGFNHQENLTAYRELALARCAEDAKDCFLRAWVLHYSARMYHRNLTWRDNLVTEMMQFACRAKISEACSLAEDAKHFPAIVAGEWPDNPLLIDPSPAVKPTAPGCDSAAVDGAMIYAEDEVDDGPKLITSADPIYPEVLRQREQNGEVILVAVVDDAGNVVGVGPIALSDKGFLNSASTAVQKRRYLPAKKCGVPVAVLKFVTVQYLVHSSTTTNWIPR